MLIDTTDWLDEVLTVLADVRAMLLCMNIRDASLEARIDQALDLASALKWDATWP